MNLAIFGAIGAGKTTLADRIVQEGIGGTSYERLRFAGALKEEVARVFVETVGGYLRARSEMDDPIKKEWWRPALQWWGQAKREWYGEDYWIRKLMGRVDAVRGEGHAFVIDDCRYQNEYDALKARGFRFLYVAPGPEYDWTDLKHRHPSEQDWPRWVGSTDLTLPWEPVEDRMARVRDLVEGGTL